MRSMPRVAWVSVSSKTAELSARRLRAGIN